jgi:hypothetical protein
MWNGRTGVIDQYVDASRAGFDLLEGVFDRFVAGEIDLYQFKSIGCIRAFFVKGLDCTLTLLHRTAANQDVVWPFRLQQRLHSLIANAVVTAGDEHNLRRRHG